MKHIIGAMQDVRLTPSFNGKQAAVLVRLEEVGLQHLYITSIRFDDEHT